MSKGPLRAQGFQTRGGTAQGEGALHAGRCCRQESGSLKAKGVTPRTDKGPTPPPSEAPHPLERDPKSTGSSDPQRRDTGHPETTPNKEGP